MASFFVNHILVVIFSLEIVQTIDSLSYHCFYQACGKTSLHNYLSCVEQDIKLYSLTSSSKRKTSFYILFEIHCLKYLEDVFII